MNRRPLIIGIGNPLRGDDGVGWAVVARLRESGRTDIDLREVHQLTPELANDIASASVVCFVDASVEGTCGETRVRRIDAQISPSSSGTTTHFSTPSDLMLLAELLYGEEPPTYVIGISVTYLGLTEQLTPMIAARIDPICDLILKLVAREAL
jgi:hydrogenase maturation protease